MIQRLDDKPQRTDSEQIKTQDGINKGQIYNETQA